jgi:uncharacterized protein YcaQ
MDLSADEARRLALRAQGLLGAPDRRGGAPALLRALGLVQLDTISVLARSHELVAYARLGAIGRAAVERAYWGGGAFEYWAHAACILPVEQWPWFAYRRRAFRARGRRWHDVPEGACEGLLQRLADEGALTTGDLGGAKASAEWWDWSHAKVAIEWLLDIGEVVCTERRGWRRVYDLPSRVLDPALLAANPSDAECVAALVGGAARALGVATVADLAEHHRLTQVQVRGALEAAGLVEVGVGGWDAPGWAHPDVLAAGPARGRHRTTLLSPFDSLIFTRPRTERLFGFTHRLEAYVPKPKRVHGYFVMPLLAGGRLVGRVDPAREGTTLVARQLSVRPDAIEPMASALREAAGWVGCDDVVLERVEPASAARPLRAALALD